MGFDGLFFGRADYQDQIHRGEEKRLEMVWKASANLGKYFFKRFALSIEKKMIARSTELAFYGHSSLWLWFTSDILLRFPMLRSTDHGMLIMTES